jgi:hypothetical protein
MEKLDYLIWRRDGLDIARHRDLLLEDANRVSDEALGFTLFVADTDEDIPKPTLLMGRGPDLAAVASVWLDTIDDRGTIEDALGPRADGYLVTESVPQRRVASDEAQITHFTWFAKPERLSYDDFLHGWHDVHTPTTSRLHPTRLGYTRDTVARVLTPGAQRVDAIVFEYFTIDDYNDPRRLYGSKDAIDETMSHLPLYADYELLNSRPMREHVVKGLT